MTTPSSLTRRRLLQLAAAAPLLPLTRLAQAAPGYPSRPVSVVVPYAPGGQGDVFARLIGQPLGQALEQTVVVENRPGASGALGARLVAKADPDGHTLLLGQTGEIAINGLVMTSPGYDALQDLQGIALVGNSPLVLAVPANAPYQDLPGLLQAAREQPGRLAYASSGTATPGHIAAAALAKESGTEMIHVPYKGAGQAITDLAGGQVDFFFASASSIVSQLQGGRIRALAVSTLEPVAALADTPTVAQTLPGFDFSLWGGYFAPAGTPAQVIDQLNTEINAIIQTPKLRERFEAEGSAVNTLTPAAFNDFVRNETEKYRRLIADLGVRLDG